MADPIRWGILGAARFAREHMAEALHLAEGGTLAALATRSPEKAAPFRAIAPAMKVHDSYDALLSDPEIDAVYIPLPNTMHVAWSLRALEAGKHVLCEKPVAMQTGEIDTLIAARDRAGRLAAEAFMIVFHPQWQFVRQTVAEGGIGRLVHVQAAISFDNRHEPDNIRNDPDRGGGALRDIGVYVLGGPRFVTGAEPREISARLRWEGGVDVVSRIAADLGGAGYQAVVSTRMAPSQSVTFFGEAGWIRMHAPFNAELAGDVAVEIARPDGSRAIHRFAGARQYANQAAAFNAAARAGSDYACPLEFSRGTQAALDALFAAAGAP